MEREMNFWDLCVACGRGIGNLCKAAGKVLAHMLRLTAKYWYLVLPLAALGIAGAIYRTTPDKLVYRVNATAMINGASIMQFEQAFQPLRATSLLPEEAAITAFVKEQQVSGFDTHRIIDALHDGQADYVDFKGKSSPTDTTKVQMKDRLNIQFRVRARDMHLLPQIEQAVLDFLNKDANLQLSYEAYVQNLREEVAFNHRQVQKLDSLTSVYYFESAGAKQAGIGGNGVNFYGDRQVKLFLNKIYEQHMHTQQTDFKMQLATAPVVLENHFMADSKPVLSRFKCLVLYVFLMWCFGCALAELIYKRKELIAWLKL